MSYEIVKSLKLNSRENTVEYTAAANNVRDFRGKLIFDKFKKQMSKEEFEDFNFGFISGILDGVIHTSNQSIKKRIGLLYDLDLISDDNKLKSDNEAQDKIKAVWINKWGKPNTYIVADLNNEYFIKFNTCSIKVVSKHSKMKPTKFFSKRQASEALGQLNKLDASYYHIKTI